MKNSLEFISYLGNKKRDESEKQDETSQVQSIKYVKCQVIRDGDYKNFTYSFQRPKNHRKISKSRKLETRSINLPTIQK